MKQSNCQRLIPTVSDKLVQVKFLLVPASSKEVLPNLLHSLPESRHSHSKTIMVARFSAVRSKRAPKNEVSPQQAVGGDESSHGNEHFVGIYGPVALAVEGAPD